MDDPTDPRSPEDEKGPEAVNGDAENAARGPSADNASTRTEPPATSETTQTPSRAQQVDPPAGDDTTTEAGQYAKRRQLKDLILDTNYGNDITVTKHISSVQVRKPNKTTWFMAHSDPRWRVILPLLEVHESREVYVVGQELLGELQGLWTRKLLVACMTTGGAFFLLPIKLPDSEGQNDSWNNSALDMVNRYAGRWVRRVANMEAGAYDIYTTNNGPPEPSWPEEPFEDLVLRAFDGKILDNIDHPVVRKLRGHF